MLICIVFDCSQPSTGCWSPFSERTQWRKRCKNKNIGIFQNGGDEQIPCASSGHFERGMRVPSCAGTAIDFTSIAAKQASRNAAEKRFLFTLRLIWSGSSSMP